MPFETPTPDQIAFTIGSRIETELTEKFGPFPIDEQPDATSGNSVLSVIAIALAAVVYPLHLFAQRQSQELFPTTAIDKLPDAGTLWGIGQRQPGAARGTVRITGLTGTVLQAGSELKLASSIYVTLADATVAAGGFADVAVEATEPGKAGNAAPGQMLGIVVPVPGLDPTAAIRPDASGAGFSGGVEIEVIEDWRDRIIDRVQQPPHGGNVADYKRWAKEVPGVAQVAISPEEFGPGSVGVCFSVVGDSPVPTAEQVAAVKAHIEEVRPVTARVSVYAVKPYPIDLALEVIPNLAVVKAAVEAAARSWFVIEAAIGEPFFRSRLSEMISAEVGEYAHRILAPTTDLTIPPGHIPVIGTFVLTGGCIVRRDRESYAAEISSMLPEGFAWTREPDSTLQTLLTGLAEGLYEVDGRIWDLINEADPRTATEMLPEWEELVGLPDDCLSFSGSTLQERRRAVATKYTATGGASRAYFIGLAKTLLNQDVKIEEFQPFRVGRSRVGDRLTNDPWNFTWRVRAPGYPAPVRFRVGRSAVGDRLVQQRPNPLECLFRRLKPAHTVVLFLYGAEA